MADLKFAVYAIDHASKTFGKVGKSMDGLGKKSEGMGKKFAKFGAIAATGAAAAGAAVGAFAVVAVKAAAEDEASQRKLAQTMKKTQKATADQIAATEKWIDTTSRASGVADDELRPALSKLIIAGESTAEAQAHVALAMDIAAASGKDLATVTAAMQKAANGNVGSLGRLGIATKSASGETLTYEQILDKAQKTMSGAAASAANTYEGKMKRVSVAMQEAKETIGAKLLPVLASMADWVLNTGIPALSRMYNWFRLNIMPIIRQVAGTIRTKLIEGLESLRAAMKRNKPEMDALALAARKIGAWILTHVGPVLAKFYGTWLPALFKAIETAIDYVSFLMRAFKKFAEVTEKVARGIAAPFISAFNAIKWAWNSTLGGMSFSMPDIPGVPGRGTTWSVPEMASGGIVNRPTLALIGESGPEAVIPLSRGRGMGGVTVVINGSVLSDEKKIADAVLRALKSQRSGGRALGLA